MADIQIRKELLDMVFRKQRYKLRKLENFEILLLVSPKIFKQI